MAGNPLTIADNRNAARAGKGVGFGGNPLLKSHAGGEGLEHRAWFVEIHNGLILPLLLPGQGQSPGLLIPGQRGDLGRRSGIADRKGLVGVVVPFCGHGQDGTSVDVLDNHRPPVGGGGVCDGFLQILFRVGLDILVNGQHQAFTVLGVHFFFVFQGGGHLVAPAVAGGNDPARLAGEHRIILGLQALQAGVVGPHKAQDVGQGVPQRIIPFVILEISEAADAVLLHPFG